MPEGEAFVVRRYTKVELASWYIGKRVCRATARRWIAASILGHTDLMAMLRSLGYQPTQRIFSELQVHAIVYFIGKPR